MKNKLQNACLILMTVTLIYGVIELINVRKQEANISEQAYKAQIENQMYWRKRADIDHR